MGHNEDNRESIGEDMIEITKNGKVISHTKNLEGLSTYNRKQPVIHSSATRLGNGKGSLSVTFRDGAKARVQFGDFKVLKDWLDTKKKRSGWG